MTLPPGTRLGRYEVRASLGAGGMGEVYLAHDPDLERDVAIKVLRDGAGSADRVRRFVQEAKAASALHHPNVAHVYEIGSHDDLHFIAMEMVAGQTLRQRIAGEPLSIDEALSVGMQIAAGLAAAHNAGIVHRDVKPENVILHPDGYAKVLDFGLAKLRELRGDDAATLLKTDPGITMGTLGYMAPEQLSGGDVTPAADVFSLGVVLYEMIAGRRPFEGATATEIVASILSRSPQPLRELRRDVPPKLEAVISKALAKNADQRFPAAGEMLEELKLISRESLVAAAPAVRGTRGSGMAAALRIAIVIAIIVAAGWWLLRTKRERDATARIATAERHLERRALPEAYGAAVAAAAVLPGNDRLREVISLTSGRVSIESDPPGATVFFQRFKGPETRTRAGTTPLTIPRLAHADYIVTLEKKGFATAYRPLAQMPLYARAPVEPVTLKVKLMGEGALIPRMVHVQGGEYRLAGWARPSDRAVQLHDFFIDRFEVSNRDFEQFVRDGGYRRPELWRHRFVHDGKSLSFEEATGRFRDTTGLPGPRSWAGGAPPADRENHPVTGVSWYEAAAFAEWKGKRLPTIYQWEKAARHPVTQGLGASLPWGIVGEGVDATERANFIGKGTMPVESMPFGMSPWGAHHMAGNVAEWCRNPKEPGFAVRGGSWDDAVYAFGGTGGFPPFYTSPTIGFRCVRDLDGGGENQGEFALGAAEAVPDYKPVDDRRFGEIRSRYDYAKVPLTARVIETIETSSWRREKIVYEVAGKRVLAYLYLPKGFRPPFQVVHFSPAGDVVRGLRTLPASIELSLGPSIRAGRAAFGVVMEGFIERPPPPGFEQPDSRSLEYIDYVVAQVTELRRGLDYLETRRELDTSKMAFVAPSAGSVGGVLLTALENRYRSVLLVGSGVRSRELATTEAANRINFAPRISAPKLMLQGRYDETAPLKSEAEPLFRLLREPKRLEIYEGGHVPPRDLFVRTIQKWLDETLGPVG